MNQPNDSLGESITKEIAGRKKEKTKHHEEDFQALIIKKNQEWYQKSTYRKSSG